MVLASCSCSTSQFPAAAAACRHRNKLRGVAVAPDKVAEGSYLAHIKAEGELFVAVRSRDNLLVYAAGQGHTQE